MLRNMGKNTIDTQTEYSITSKLAISKINRIIHNSSTSTTFLSISNWPTSSYSKLRALLSQQAISFFVWHEEQTGWALCVLSFDWRRMKAERVTNKWTTVQKVSPLGIRPRWLQHIETHPLMKLLFKESCEDENQRISLNLEWDSVALKHFLFHQIVLFKTDNNISLTSNKCCECVNLWYLSSVSHFLIRNTCSDLTLAYIY